MHTTEFVVTHHHRFAVNDRVKLEKSVLTSPTQRTFWGTQPWKIVMVTADAQGVKYFLRSMKDPGRYEDEAHVHADQQFELVP